MEDESQKRSTDCVYFLASPLTCKKGSGCEFRHSENARFNPRDCWYWLNGNCLNPACSFRHPPLDGRPEASSVSVHLSPHSAVASVKTNHPCYFFFNAYCIKGDKCPFLHGPDNLSSGWKSSKTAAAGTDIHPLENKVSTESDTRPVSVEAPPNPSDGTSVEVNLLSQPKDVQVEAPNNISKHSPSPLLSLPNCKEAAVELLDTPPPMVSCSDYTRRPLVSEDQSSDEEQTNNYAEPEERWESSPGFDVLVDRGSEHFGYEEAEYPGVRDEETRGLQNHLFQHNYEDLVGYDPMGYPDAEIVYEHGIYDLHDHVDNDYPSDYARRVPDHVREKMTTIPKRKLLAREPKINGQKDVDLRDRLKCKRDGHHGFYGSRKRQRHSSCVVDDNREHLMKRGMGHALHGTLASEVGESMIRSRRGSDSGLRGGSWSGRLRRLRSRHTRRKMQESSRKQARSPSLSSEIAGGLRIKDTKSMRDSAAFTGPKTLAQIKEEKRRASAGDDSSRNVRSPAHQNSGGTVSETFEGPKPLSELIRSKRISGSVIENQSQSTGRSSEHRRVQRSLSRLERGNRQFGGSDKTGYHRTNGRQFEEEEDDSCEDYDDSELEKELAGILN
eukprot:TRINITY_DN29255_c0_g1_i1.p1 TRINITY_DN29255_c0_g1~~TRINITY_DN29255_c0_g1_i1.p1  ORF type:complete len:613 (-),score=134.17 TRINITY_DN29255_c0_g1_i1:372-2210(-)